MGGPVDILIFAIEAGRYGPARLPQNLESVGLRVATLCPVDNVLAHTDHVQTAYHLPPTRNAARLARALTEVVAECQPRLVIPADEQAVVLLHGFIGGGCGAVIGADVRALLLRSLGPADRLAPMLFKSRTLALARSIGVRVPEGATVATAAQARAVAEGLPMPAYVKQSFGWAGQGVTRCDTPEAAAAAFIACHPPVGRVKSAVRRLLGRDWYPDTSEVDVQAGVVGRPAMICALAWGGRMVGSFAGETLRTISATGPSTEVRIGPHPAMSEASGRMIAALGCTGWIGFDFMIEAATGAPVLIECNPRPIQIGHLGYRIGVDLSAALAALLRGGAVPDVPLAARETLDILLFPHALDPMALRAGVLADMPMTDAGLMRYGAGLARGRGPDRLPIGAGAVGTRGLGV